MTDAAVAYTNVRKCFDFTQHIAAIGPRTFKRMYRLSIDDFEALHGICAPALHVRNTSKLRPGRLRARLGSQAEFRC